MKKIIKPGLILLISVFLGCETADDVGVSFPLQTGIGTEFIEFTLPASNVYIDSLRTDQEDFFLVGNFSDQLTGNIWAEGYFQYSFVEGTLPFSAQDVLPSGEDTLRFIESSDTLSLLADSLVLELEVRNVLPNNEGLFSLELSDLTTNLESSVVYLSRNRQISDDILASFNGGLRTITDNNGKILKNSDSLARKSIRIKLDENTTSSFFQLVAEVIKDSTQSLQGYEFKDLVLSPLADNEGLAEIIKNSDFSNLTLYMDDSEDDSVYTALFPLGGTHYSYIERDKAGTEFEGLDENMDLELSDGRTIIEPLSGLSTAFSMDQLEDFFANNEDIVINNASLHFEIDESLGRDTLLTFTSYLRKPDKSFLASAGASSQTSFSATIASDQSFFGSEISSARSVLNENLEEGNKASLSIGCTQFLGFILDEYYRSNILQFNSPFEENPRLIDEFILIDQTDLSLNRTIFKKDGIKLRIYYTELED